MESCPGERTRRVTHKQTKRDKRSGNGVLLPYTTLKKASAGISRCSSTLTEVGPYWMILAKDLDQPVKTKSMSSGRKLLPKSGNARH